MRKCIKCNENKKITTKGMCQPCYYEYWKKKNEDNAKECPQCKRVKALLVEKQICRACNSHNYYFKNKEESLKKARERIKRYRLENPEKAEHYRKLARDHHRRKVGIDVNLPLLLAPAGSGHIHENGYKLITVKGHPNSSGKNGAIFEHQYVMSQHLGRPLRKGETIHHKNGVRLDNRIENLEIWHKSHPPGQRVEDKIKWCKEFLESYGYIVSDNLKV